MWNSRNLMPILALSLVSFAAAAQTEPSLWPGTIKAPGKSIQTVEFVVDPAGDKPKVQGFRYSGVDFPFREVKWTEESVSYEWKPGPEFVACELKYTDTLSLQGDCAIPDSPEKIEMSLRLPAPPEGSETPETTDDDEAIVASQTEPNSEGGDPEPAE